MSQDGLFCDCCYGDCNCGDCDDCHWDGDWNFDQFDEPGVDFD
jgi:hypothetical protein